MREGRAEMILSRSQSCRGGNGLYTCNRKMCFHNRHHGSVCKMKSILYLQIRVLCLHLEKLNLLKISLANSGLRMTYLYVFHVAMNILLLLQVSITILDEESNS